MCPTIVEAVHTLHAESFCQIEWYRGCHCLFVVETVAISAVPQGQLYSQECSYLHTNMLVHQLQI